MGQVIEVQLSCYLLLLSVDTILIAKPEYKTAAPLLPDTPPLLHMTTPRAACKENSHQNCQNDSFSVQCRIWQKTNVLFKGDSMAIWFANDNNVVTENSVYFVRPEPAHENILEFIRRIRLTHCQYNASVQRSFCVCGPPMRNDVTL